MYFFLVHGLDILVLNCPKGPDRDILVVQNESRGARAPALNIILVPLAPEDEELLLKTFVHSKPTKQLSHYGTYIQTGSYRPSYYVTCKYRQIEKFMLHNALKIGKWCDYFTSKDKVDLKEKIIHHSSVPFKIF